MPGAPTSLSRAQRDVSESPGGRPRLRYDRWMAIAPEDIRAFARRRWDLVEDSKREFIADRYREDPIAHARSIEALREHLRAVRPEWPTQDDLARDLEDHIALKRKLDRAAPFVRHR